MALPADVPGGRMLALVRHNTTLLLREPGPLLSRLTMPLVAVAVFEPLDRAALGAGGPAQAVTGMLVLFSMLGLSIVGTSIVTERLWHTWDRLRTTPARPLELVAGKAVPVLGALFVQQAAILGFGAGVEGMHVADLALLVLAVALWSMTLLAIGSALALVVRSQAEFAAAQDIGSFIATSLGGALVPLSRLPAWARHVAPASPGYWAMSAFRGALSGDPRLLVHAAGVLLAVTAAATGLAAWRVTRGGSRSSRL